MADFRRWIFALALLALFAGLANAQLMSCTAAPGSTPFIRNEGFTELVGDIVVTCTGGAAQTGTTTSNPNLLGSITIYLNAPVTSRLLGISTTGNNPSEATLLIDDPTTNATPMTQAEQAANGGTVYPVVGCAIFATCAGTVAAPSNGVYFATPTTANAFPGTVSASGTSITWNGIPVIPPGTTNTTFSRTFRITNVRVNANNLAAGSISAGSTAVNAVVVLQANSQPLVNGTSVQVASAVASLTTGFATGLGPSSSAANLLACSSTQTFLFGNNPVFKSLTYTDTFATAFKTKVATGGQSVPGGNSGTESGWVPTGGNIFGGSYTPGLADYGTRLKAVFKNIPANATVWVPTMNTVSGSSSNPTAVTSGATAQLIASETAVFSPVGNGANQTVGTGTAVYVPIPNINGTSIAVWEITQASGVPTTLNFPIAILYNSITSTSNPVTLGTVTVNQSYAPTPASGVFAGSATTTLPNGAAASASLTIPRFADTGTDKAFININACRTVLLYPFVSSAAGFETGIGIANTSQDPFGTAAQSGTCTLNFYGSGAPSPAPVTASIAGGTVYANAVGAGLGVNNFTGYLIAVCNFQYAHGYASLFSGFGTSAGVFSSYAAGVIPDPGTTIFGRPTACGAAPTTLTGAAGTGITALPITVTAASCQAEVLGF